MPGQNELVLDNQDGWLDYTSKYAQISSKLPENLAPSQHILAAKASETRTLLFLFGQGDSSSFGGLDVLEISDDGQPGVVLHSDEFSFAELRDLDGDGIPEMVGKTCISETWGNGLLTYASFNFYKLGAAPGAP